jgi:hypothetical protein
VPALDGENRLHLTFRPRIRHGKARLETHVARDPDGLLRWTREAREPIEDFNHLRWEVTVGTEEYVVIGARLDHPDTLGTAYFLPEGIRGGTQKLLVLRATLVRSGEGPVSQVPLALQASLTARGSRR